MIKQLNYHRAVPGWYAVEMGYWEYMKNRYWAENNASGPYIVEEYLNRVLFELEEDALMLYLSLN